MSEKTYIIYCDESDKRGRYYSNFFGGVILAASERDQISRELEQAKLRLGLTHELKWQCVDQSNVDRYIEFVKVFFNYVAASRLKVRVMFTQNMRVPQNLLQRHHDEQYFLFYYQFVKHAFGIRYCDHGPDRLVRFHIMPDQFPENKLRVERFKDYLCRIPSSRLFRGINVAIPRNDISDVDSKSHVILQCLDIVLGSMCFRLNDKHKEIPKGARRRGKRTIAKERLYKAINREIRSIYPNFNIGVGTACHYGPSDRWTQPYRHWLFMPTVHTIDRRLGKRAAPGRPT